MDKYVVLEKAVGETPLSCAEAWRAKHPEYVDVPLAYAGRLDPMASGKLLVLIGDECKNQTNYHSLDKAYDFSVLFGIESDSLDVLGRLTTYLDGDNELSDCVRLGLAPRSAQSESAIVESLIGDIELPYPRFSAKTVQGKPLHMWTLEGRLDEIEIPTKTSTIYSLALSSTAIITKKDLVEQALTKINSIPEVTDPRKALGNDFRRVDVRQDWNAILENKNIPDEFQIAHFTCVASSGTYMRTLAHLIAQKLNTCGLAWSIHRTHIGTYDPVMKTWTTLYT